ncbi:hypothetical protein AWP83_20860 [Escherichia coli]|nr:hypothetical protein AWP83_20860 [Escherichia coli]
MIRRVSCRQDTDATGSTRQMAWSRYGQLLAFTDCSGYPTRYEYDRFGQMSAFTGRKVSALPQYDPRGRLVGERCAGA